MSQKNSMNEAVRFALGLTASAVALNIPLSVAQDESATDVEEVVVTGSRITRSTLNSESQDTITISAEDMEITGDVSIADALRSSNLNSLGSFRESSGSSAQSNATVDLRGVGAGRTLVLVNGRRVVGSPQLGGGGTVNLNLIPFSAVDRIEIVADGASAVYGSDAVAGVVNVILKRGYDGLTVSARYGDRDRDSGETNALSFLFGASSDKGNVTFGIEWDTKDPIFDADRDFTAARWGDYNGDGLISGYQETVGVSIYGYTLVNPTWDVANYLAAGGFPDVADPNDPTSWYFHPGSCENADGSDGFVGPLEYYGYGFYCGYAFALVSANRAGLDRLHSWVSAEYELSDTVDAYVDAIFAQNESFGRYAPPAAPGPVIPGDPRNTVGATYGYFRWTDIGFRDNVVTDTFVDLNAGLKWDITDGISADFNYTHSDYKSSSPGNYYLSYSGLAYNIAYGIDDFDTFVANIKATTLDDSSQVMRKYSGGVQFDLFDMAGGTAIVYAGVERYDVRYVALVDAQSEAGLIGGSAGNSAAGDRDVTAFFAETILPVTDWLEISAAVRRDKYSDFGSATSPRIGFAMSVPGYEQLRVHGSWGKGFRAPDLSDMFGATAFSAERAIDYWACEQSGISADDCNSSRQVNTYINSNPDLDAETSTSLSFGVEWDFIENWQVKANWISLELSDALEYISAQKQLDLDYVIRSEGGAGNPNVDRSTARPTIQAQFENQITDVKREALDVGIAGNIPTDFGMFRVNWAGTKYLQYDFEGIYGSGEISDVAGTLGFPEWRMNAYVSWTMNNYFANLSWDYIGESKSSVSSTKYAAWDQFNASVGYNFSEYGRLTVGATNITDEDPLLNSFGEQVDEYQYPLTGRVMYVDYTIEF